MHEYEMITQDDNVLQCMLFDGKVSLYFHEVKVKL